MHFLQNFKYNEIVRGRLNKGNFRLKAMHQNASLERVQDVCDPMKIIDLVKGDLNAILSEKESKAKLHEYLLALLNVNMTLKLSMMNILIIRNHWV